jgi:hypothetical protein
MSNNLNNEIFLIKGVMIPTQWDKRGQIIQVALQTDSFEKYIIDEDANPEYLKWLDKHVRVQAQLLGEDLVGCKIIKIHRVISDTDIEIKTQEETIT